MRPVKHSKKPFKEVHIDFDGPIFNEKDQEVNFLACIVCFSNFPYWEVYDHANANNFYLKIFQNYILLNGVPRHIRSDQVRCQIGKQITNFCEQNHIEVITAPTNYNRAIGLAERLIQTIKRRLRCYEESARSQFNS